MGKIILTASGKGGVGKSFFTVNLGATLAKKGYKVLLIDMNTGLRNLDIYLGLENNIIFDIADILGDICAPKRAMVKDKRYEHLYIIAASHRKDKLNATEEDLKNLYEKLEKDFDFIIVDGAAGVNEDIKMAATGVDMAVIVTTMEPVALRDADMMDQILYEFGVENRGYIINKIDEELIKSNCVTSFEELPYIINAPLLGLIQFDRGIQMATNVGVPIIEIDNNYIAKNFDSIAERICE